MLNVVASSCASSSFQLARPYGDLVSNVESPWVDSAVTATHNRNLRVSFTWMPAPQVFGWPEHRERQRAILEQAACHFDAGELRVVVGATFSLEQTADAHRALDKAVDAAYGYRGAKDDAARVAYLFGLYQRLTSLMAPKPRKRASRPSAPEPSA